MIAPAMICPSPPMLITPALKAMQIPEPTSSNGIDFSAVSASSSQPPNAPAKSARYPCIGSPPSASSMIAPTASAATTAPTGTIRAAARRTSRCDHDSPSDGGTGSGTSMWCVSSVTDISPPDVVAERWTAERSGVAASGASIGSTRHTNAQRTST